MITSKIIKIFPISVRRKIESNEQLMRILGNINWLTAGILLRDVIGLFMTAWIARYLGPEQFGIMNYALAFVALFSALSTLGLDDISVRNLVSQPEKKGKYLGTIFFLKFVGAILMLIISVVSVSLIKENDSQIRWFVCLVAFGYIFKSLDVIDLFFQSQIKSKFSVYARSISFLIITVLRIVLIQVQAPLEMFVLMNVVDLFLISIFYILFYIKNSGYSFSKWEVNRNIIKELLVDCWPIIISGFMVMIYMKIDQIMIGNMLNQKELGLYSAVVKLSEAWYFIPTVIAGSCFPSILNAKRKDSILYFKRLQTLYDLFTWFSIIFAFIITMLSSFIIKTLYGAEYIGAVPVLAVHIWAGVPVFLGSASGKYLISENLTKISLYKAIAGAVVNVLLNFLLIPRIGIIGAAISTLVSYVVSTFFVLLIPQSRQNGIAMLKSFNIFGVIRRLKNELR